MPQANTAPAEIKPNSYKEFSANVRVVSAQEKRKKSNGNASDVVATITDDSVDGDREVVLPGGMDKSRFIKAPRIMLCHAYGRSGDYYPFPIGKALWTEREGNAIKQGILFAKDEVSTHVANLFRDGMLNTFSIGFISERSSPPSKEEKSARPEWADADLIHRRWKLLEVSVVPIPSNENAIGEWVRKCAVAPRFLWAPNRKGFLMPGLSDDSGSAPEKPDLAAGTLVKLNALAGGGWGRVKSLHLGVVPEVDDDATDGSNEWAAKVSILGENGQEVGQCVGALVKHLDLLTDKSYHGHPWMGEEAEKNDAYRVMARGLLDRHAKIMHSRKAGHLYANQKSMEGHYVRHKADDNAEKGYHTAEQCKAMLEGAPACKGLTVSMDHPEEEAEWEMLHPAPERSAMWVSRAMKPKDDESAETEEDDEEEEGEAKGMGVCAKCGGKMMADPDDDEKMICAKCGASMAKALEEGSGTGGGYTTPEKVGSEDDEITEEVPAYMPKPREVVSWENHEGMHAGAGKVMSVHKSGRIPNVVNEAMADEKTPHARVNLFKRTDDGDYEETDHHVAVKCMHLKRMPILRVGAKAAPVAKVQEKTAQRTESDEPTLSRIPKFQTVGDFQAEVRRTLTDRDSDPITKQRLMDEVLANIVGAV